MTTENKPKNLEDFLYVPESLGEAHSNMVAALAKPGKEIAKSFTQQDFIIVRALSVLQEIANSRLCAVTKKTDSEPAWHHELHMTLGMVGELGELLDAIKKHIIYRKPLDLENCKEEIGDFLFYLRGSDMDQGIVKQNFFLTILAYCDCTMEEALEHNIAKLSKRYSSSTYSDQQAKERADKAEEQGE